MAELRVSTVDAYVEAGSGAPTLLVSAVPALLEFRSSPAAQVTGVYAYAEFEPETSPIVTTDPALDTVRIPRGKLEVQWDGVNWTDETQYLISASGGSRISAPGEQLVPPGDIATARVLLWNPDGRFSWRRTDGPLYSYIGGSGGMLGIPVRLSLGFEVGGSVGAYHRIFTGVIFDWEEDGASRTVTLHLRDNGFLYVQKRASTTVYQGYRVDELISLLSTLAGIGSPVIDPSPYTIPYAWLDDESILGEIWGIAQVDGGRVYFDRGGALRFEQAAHWVGHSTPAWELDADDYTGVELELDPEGLLTKVKVEIQPRSPAASGEVYQLDVARAIPPGETIEFDCRLNQPVLSIDDPVANEDYEIVSSGGEDLSGDCTLVLAKYGQRVHVSLTNTHATHQAYLVKLTLEGQPLVGGPTQEVEEVVASPAIPFDRGRSITGNSYIQTEEVARSLAQMLRDRGSRLTPSYRLRGTPGIPQLNLGDRVSFVDPQGVSGTLEGFVSGISWSLGEGGFTQEITLIDASRYFPYDDYFIIGTTALGSHGRCWY